MKDPLAYSNAIKEILNETDNVDDIGPGPTNRSKTPRLNVMPAIDPRTLQEGKISTPKRGFVDEPGSYAGNEFTDQQLIDLGFSKGSNLQPQKETYKKSLDILNSMGKNVIYAGKSGMGQIFKMCNQIMVGSHIQAMCEAFALCKSKGGNLALLRETLIGGSANSWMLENFGNAVIDKNEKAGFRIDLQLKDLKLASDAAFEGGVPLPGLSLVLALYLETRAHNEGKNGNQSLFKAYDRMTNQN